MKNAKIIIVVLLIVVIALVGVVLWYMNANKEPVIEYFVYDTGDVFVTNVVSSKALLKTHITIELTDKDTLAFCEENQFKVRDSIIGILRAKTYDVLTAEENSQQLKQEIMSTLSEKYELKGIENVYFNEFVIQQ